jgi:uncharacterized membrane protein
MSTKTKMLLALTVILMGIAGNVFAQFNDEAILGVWMSAKKDTKFPEKSFGAQVVLQRTSGILMKSSGIATL